MNTQPPGGQQDREGDFILMLYEGPQCNMEYASTIKDVEIWELPIYNVDCHIEKG